jgi:hypothetical protein
MTNTDTTTTDTEDSDQPRSWRDVLPIHPAAELFPLMTKDELRELADDILKNGLREKVDIYEEKDETGLCVLDGRNRMDALELLGQAVVTITGYPAPRIWNRIQAHKKFDPYAYVVSKNLHRRHLTSEQKRDVVAKALALDPTKSNRAIAATAGVSHVTVKAVRSELESTGQIDQLEKTIGKDGKARPAKRESVRDKILFGGFGDDPAAQVELADIETARELYDPALDEATPEEMRADPAMYWQELTDEAEDRLRDAFHAAREARNRDDHTAVVHALGDLIAAATEIKKFYEDHLLAAPGEGIQ